MSSQYQIFGVQVLRQGTGGEDPVLLCSAEDLASVSWAARGGAKQAMQFTAKLVAGRIGAGGRLKLQDAKEAEDRCIFAQSTSDGLVCVVSAIDKYPLRVAFNFIGDVLKEFQEKFTEDAWRKAPGKAKGEALPWPPLAQQLKKYQSPEQVDSILKCKGLIEETKVVMMDNIEQILRRGEKIDDLVQKSDDLSDVSKGFHKAARKANRRCPCSIM